MMLARSLTGARIPAVRGVPATCPQCTAAMIAKCGRLVVHHWAHEAHDDCDPWWEPETAWHRAWKQLLPADRVEVSRAGHRADIVRTNGLVVELQHSPISVPDIEARERAYGAMAWLFDGRDISGDALLLRDRGGYHSFRWKHPRKHYGMCQRPVYIDLGDVDGFGDAIFQLKRFHLDGPPYGGWGYLLPRTQFVGWLTEGLTQPTGQVVRSLSGHVHADRTDNPGP